MAAVFLMNMDPHGVLFVSSGPRGDRLLFRYPYDKTKDLERLLRGMF